MKCEKNGIYPPAGYRLIVITNFVKKILTGYAQVYFSTKWHVGLLFFLSTFMIPVNGAAGLAGLLLSNLFARLLGLSKEQRDEGYFAYNGLLTALALGLTYRINAPFVAMLIVSAFLGVLVAAALRAVSERYLFIPVLSLPFVFTSWLIIAAGRNFQGLVYGTAPFEVELLNGFFPEPLEFLFRSLGAAFFQLSIPSGILVAAGILIFSRQAFILAVLALFTGSFFYTSSGGSVADLNGQWIGFNFALTAIAVGGMFVVPGIGSCLLALMSAMLSAVIAAGFLMILGPLKLPILALPFVVTTLFVLYPLRNRISPQHLRAITIPHGSPETNLKHFKNRRVRFVTGGTPSFELPVSGEWTITQGFNGHETHKNLWAHAWDFEVTDENGKTCKDGGDNLSDYYSWGMPVFSPGDGKVVRVIHHIDDNRIGQVNTKNNWGNTVIIWHYGTVYTSLSHFAKGSITVSEGETIRRGKVIGRVGNSGRSPYPHLHFQVQYSPELGSPTAPSELVNFVSKEKGAWLCHTHGVPVKGQVIQGVEIDMAMFDAASFPIGGTWNFDVSNGKKQWRETWKSEIDFIGNRFLTCREKKAKIQFFLNNKVLLLLNYDGPSNTALEWFFLAVPRLPFTRKNVGWHEEMPAERVLPPVSRTLFDIFEPVWPLAALQASSRFVSRESETFTVGTTLSLNGRIASKEASNIDIQSTFKRHKGLISLTARRDSKTTFNFSQRGSAVPDEKQK